MKMPDMRRYLPLDADAGLEKTLIVTAALFSALISVGGFIAKYDSGVTNVIYETSYYGKWLRDGAMADDFYTLLGSVYIGWAALALGMLPLAAYHYLLHRMGGSKSIYTMRRLPSGSELHRRCLAVPCAVIALCIVCVCVFTALFYLAYIIFTPAKCIAPGQLSLLWEAIAPF